MRVNNILTIAICVFAILFSGTAMAGDIKPKGTVLSEDSYVFSIEEATKLKNRIKELEAKEAELVKYKSLESLRLKQIDLYKINLDYSQAQNQRLYGLLNTQDDLIGRYNKRNSYAQWEKFGYLTLGIALTVGAFFAADTITDQMER